MRPKIRLFLLLATVLALGVSVAACGGGEGEEPATTAAPPATQTEPATTEAGTETEPPPVETTVVSAFFLRGEWVGVAHRTIEKVEGIGAATMEELLAGPTPEEEEAGLITGIPEGTSLLGLDIADGVATVDLSGEFDDGGGSLAMFTRLAQVVYTLTQFPTVEGVNFMLDGEPVEVFSSEGIVLDHPQTRADYEDQTPAILVENPAPFDVVTSPLTMSGTAHTFEATLQYELLDADGNVLVPEGFATATCGTGCRGTWEAQVDFDAEPGTTGTLFVYELSAKDGTRTNVVEIPVEFG
jgi:hypothetical protein